MREKGITLLDIDRVVFDTDSFERMLYDKMSEQTGLNAEKLNEMRLEYRAKIIGYPIASLIDYIAKETKTDLSELQETLQDKNIYKRFIFSDVKKALTLLSRDSRLGAFTSGNENDQTNKMSSVINFFEKDLIFIAENKLEDEFLDKIPDRATIIDDRKRVIQVLYTKDRFNLIQLDRDKNSGEKIDLKGVPTVRNLIECAEIVLRAV
jgi:hypothetical protein